MNSLVLLRCPDDWVQYRRALCHESNIDFDGTRWGHGPQLYPCLALSYVVPNSRPQRVATCYVYPDDARRLLMASGPMQGMVAIPVGAVAAGPHATVLKPASGPDEATADTLRSLSAHVMALVSELVAIRATTEERYEKEYTRFLALADQVVSERADMPSVGKAIRKRDEPAGE